MQSIESSKAKDLAFCRSASVPPPSKLGHSWQTAPYGKWLAARYPDDAVLADMADNPAPARVAHDLLAQDERVLFHNGELADIIFTADPDARCAVALTPLITDCYERDATFRRLLNHHAAMSGGANPRCRLAAAEAYGMTVTDEQIAAAGGKTLTLMLDGEGLPLPAGEITAQRAMLHELLHAITGLRDDPDHLNPRGAVVEYANIVLADLGEPARASYGAGECSDSRRPEGVHPSRSEREYKERESRASDTLSRWRREPMALIDRLPHHEGVALRSLIPDLDARRNRASPDDFACVQQALLNLQNKAPVSSPELRQACAKFESDRGEINLYISRAGSDLEQRFKKIVREDQTERAISRTSDFCASDRALADSQRHARHARYDFERLQDRESDRWRSEQSKHAAANAAVAVIDRLNEAVLRDNRVVTTTTTYLVKETPGTVISDPHGRVAMWNANQASTAAIGGAAGGSSGSQQVVHTAALKEPVYRTHTVIERRKVKYDIAGQPSMSRSLDPCKPFAGPGNERTAVVESFKKNDQGVTKTTGRVVETLRLHTTHSIGEKFSSLFSPISAERPLEAIAHASARSDQRQSESRAVGILSSRTALLPPSARASNQLATSSRFASLPPPTASLPPLLMRTQQERRDDIARKLGQTSLTVAMELGSGAGRTPPRPSASSVAADARRRGDTAVAELRPIPQAGPSGAAVPRGVSVAKFSGPTPVLAPMQGISRLPNGRYAVTMNGYAKQVRFNIDKGMWCLTGRESGFVVYKKVNDAWRWEKFTPSLFRSKPTSNVLLPNTPLMNLPPIKSMPAHARPIPKKISYLWIGGRMPEKNCLNIIENARKSYNEKKNAGYRTTVYVDVDDPAVLAQMQARFRDQRSYLTVENLRETAFFHKFKETKFARQYDAARNGKHRCYAAASDVLRYPLIDCNGGIYMDADDSIEKPVAHIDLPASAKDLLLNSMISNEKLNLKEVFNNSVFGSHPNNSLLKEISEESYNRFMQDESFFDKARPYSGVTDDPDGGNDDRMNAYAQKISALGGPGLLNDVLTRNASDLYDLRLMAVDVQKAMEVDLPQKYLIALQASYDYRLPFSHAWGVAIGSDHSWEST